MLNKHKITGENGENSDCQGLQDQRNDMVVSFLGFLFASRIPKLELKKLAAWIGQWAQTKKKNNKSYLFVAKVWEKGQPIKTENF